MGERVRSAKKPALRFPKRNRRASGRDKLDSRDPIAAVPTIVPRISMAVVHDNEIAREGLTLLLSRQADMRVVASGARDLDGVPTGGAAVVLLALGAQDRDGVRRVGDVLAAAPNARVIVIGSTSACADLASLMQAGVYGFVLEDATSEELLRTIRSVASGNHVWPTAIANALFSQRAHEGAREPARGSPARMTNREREVMSLIADGLRTREIAERLGVASFTVRAHVRNIMEKLDLHTRVQIAKYVFQERAGETPPAIPVAEPAEIVHRHYRGIGSFDQYRAAEPRRIVPPSVRWASLRHESNVANGIKHA